MSLLSINDLSVSFTSDEQTINVLDRVSFSLDKGKTLGIVGESGCGKSVTALSIMRLLPQPSGSIDNGDILFDGKNLATMAAVDMRKIRGNRIAMIFQDPMTALNPVHRIGKQLMEVYQLHFPELNKQQRQQRALAMLNKVGISDPEERLKAYPHQLSGGMRQRIMIAMALACEPEILIADEPTTALDVTIQAQILELMKQLQRETGMAILFITHDLGVIAELCDDVVVMYAGRVAERANVHTLFSQPRHPYTQGLLTSIPRLTDTPKTILHTIPGQVPSLAQMPSGCRFNNRCPKSSEQCQHHSPDIETDSNHHQVACFHWQQVSS
ncbi:MAG TPA: ABC transporter ATP-binding protein [Porticoccus sp.]|nr:ABC transporter ATP-binding protein [Porticoccus sp.]